MSIESLLFLNTILLVFIAIRVHQIYKNMWLESQEKVKKEFEGMSDEDIESLKSIEVDRALSEMKKGEVKTN